MTSGDPAHRGAQGNRIDPSCDPAAFTIQAAGVGNPGALCALFLAALCEARDDEPDRAERLLSVLDGWREAARAP